MNYLYDHRTHSIMKGSRVIATFPKEVTTREAEEFVDALNGSFETCCPICGHEFLSTP